jgi:superfamily II DNA or RNA helicase
MKKNRDIVQKEALDTVANLKKAGIAVSMGVGKTLIGLKHMAMNYHDTSKFLVVASKRSILSEWLAEASKHGLEHLVPHITLTTYLSLDKELCKPTADFDVVYLDECHSLLYSHDTCLKAHFGKILGLTGSPPKYANSEKGQMVDRYCPIAYTYETDNAVDDKILNDYRIVVHRLPLNTAKDIRVERAKNIWYTSEKANYDYWSTRIDQAKNKKELQMMSIMRMKAMMEFTSKEKLAIHILRSIEDKCIVFANTQEQADRMCAFSYHSNNPLSDENLMLFKLGEVTKLSAVLQLNEGVNIPNLKQGIILHAYGNERKSSQRIGRLLRLNPDDTATVHILCYKDTVDERWVNSALEGFDINKIKYVDV